MTTRPLRLACLSALLLGAAAAHAASDLPCSAGLLATLGRQVKVAHFVPGPKMREGNSPGVIVAATCKRLPADTTLTLAAVAWDAGKEDEKSLVLGLVDEAAGKVVASLVDAVGEDASTQIADYSLRLDTAAYDLAPGVRAVGLDIDSENRGCGEGAFGASRTLYVREGATFRAVLADLTMSQSWYLRGNQRRCVSTQREADSAILEDYALTIGIGAPGQGGWRDLLLTATSRRSDRKPGRKPFHFRVPYDGKTYPLEAFHKAYDKWRE